LRVRISPFAWVLALIALVAGLAVALDRRATHRAALAAEVELPSTLDVTDALSGEADPRFLRATTAREFDFPRDHGPHEGFRTEWWYLTANLFDAGGAAFGAQLTFFRNALAPPGALDASRSELRDPHVWMAHFALSDERRGLFRAAERFAREGGGLAGARAVPFAVHVGDWRIESAGESFQPLRLGARQGELELALELEAREPPVLQGDAGLSAKGPEPGNASYYYSMPRLAARGRLRIGGREHAVTGDAWLDREWSTSALGPDLAGWDWFALQLDDGRELMVYRLRRKDGRTDPHSAGTLVAADGGVARLAADDVRITPLSTWTSPRGASYPGRWRLEIPGHALDLELRPRLDDQELALTVRYWEGAVTAAGRSGGAPVTGQGFVEMTGYDGRNSGIAAPLQPGKSSAVAATPR
jgi:predicted secreted hydrolase